MLVYHIKWKNTWYSSEPPLGLHCPKLYYIRPSASKWRSSNLIWKGQICVYKSALPHIKTNNQICAFSAWQCDWLVITTWHLILQGSSLSARVLPICECRNFGTQRIEPRITFEFVDYVFQKTKHTVKNRNKRNQWWDLNCNWISWQQPTSRQRTSRP